MNADRKKEIDKALCSFFFGCNIPFITVESEYFINLLRILNPDYIPPTRKTLSGTLLDQQFNEYCESVYKEETQKGILLLDGWKNSVANTKNVVAIVRTTNGNNAFLESWNFSEIRETGEALTIVVRQCMEIAIRRYNIDIYEVITDNASNMINMGQQVNLWNVTCNSHSGNLLFKSLTDNEFDGKVTAVVKDFKTPYLESRLINAGGKKMILPGGTRWCSRRDSYRRCLENTVIMRNIIRLNEIEDRQNQFQFKDGVIETILDDEFEINLTNALLAYDPVCSLVNVCQKSDCSISIATEQWLKLELPFNNERFEIILRERLSKVINKFGLVANFLHPLYKGRRFAANAQYIAMRDQFFQENLTAGGMQELRQYTDQTGAFDRIFRARYRCWKVFWRAAGRFYPELSALAIELLYIPASTGDLERLFSEWSLVHSKTRNRLKEHRSSKLVALYYALRLRYTNNFEDIPDDEIEEE